MSMCHIIFRKFMGFKQNHGTTVLLVLADPGVGGVGGEWALRI